MSSFRLAKSEIDPHAPMLKNSESTQRTFVEQILAQIHSSAYTTFILLSLQRRMPC